ETRYRPPARADYHRLDAGRLCHGSRGVAGDAGAGRQTGVPGSIPEKPLVRATFSARASWREPVEHARVLPEHARLHRLAEVRPPREAPRRLREVAVPVGIIARVEDELRPQHLG